MNTFTTNLNTAVHNHPLISLALSFSGGLLLGALLSG